MLFLFCLSMTTLLLTYVGYPAALWLLARLSGRPHATGDETPTVTVLVAAHQEIAVIREKLENFATIDYPERLLDMVVVSDDSTDGTDDVVREFQSSGIRLLRQEPRQGKAAALGLGLKEVSADIVVLTDANVVFDKQAVRRLVKHFADAEVGIVTGTVELIDTKTGYAESEGMYYRYERFLQEQESRLWSVVGVDGALYAVRRELIEAPPAGAILDDFVISMEVAKQHRRILYDPDARATEDAAGSIGEEFRRKVRVATGAYQSLVNGWGVPGFGTPRLLFCYLGHKALRWLAPWFLLAALVSNLTLAAASPLWLGLALAQVAFYALALLGLAVPATRSTAPVSVPMYFVIMNAAFAWGFIRGMSGPIDVRWKTVRP